MNLTDSAELSLVTAPSDMVFYKHLVFAQATMSTEILMISWVSELYDMLTEDLILKCAMRSYTGLSLMALGGTEGPFELREFAVI